MVRTHPTEEGEEILTVRELLDQLDLQGESQEEVYVWDWLKDKAIRVHHLEHIDGKLLIL
jgi:DNA-dependent RNA polymerase auxiliary subunit epsilon